MTGGHGWLGGFVAISSYNDHFWPIDTARGFQSSLMLQITSRSVFLTILVALSAIADEAQPPHCFDHSLDSEHLTEDISATALETFERLEPGMARDIVLKLVGFPTFLCGSGLAYDVYVLSDGQRVWIAYLDGKASWGHLYSPDSKIPRILFGKTKYD